MSPELSRRIAASFYTMKITLGEKDRVIEAARAADKFTDLAPEIRALIIKGEPSRELRIVGRKFNENHDEHGRFSSSDGAGSEPSAYERGMQEPDSAPPARSAYSFTGKMGDISIYGGTGLPAASKELFGRELKPEEYARLAGAPDGSDVEVRASGSFMGNGVAIAVRNADLELTQLRSINTNEAGQVEIHNSLFTVRQSPDTEGIGIRALATEVAAARELGVTRITTDAARAPDMNGYYTWPRLGFDGVLATEDYDEHRYAIEQAQQGGIIPADSQYPKVSDLMATPEGRDWWKENGWSIDVTLDLNDEGGKKFDEYAASKGVTA